MGLKGDKLTNEAGEIAERFVTALSSLGEVSAKKMFGGYGVFHEAKMFGIINSKGEVFLKADDVTKIKFEAADQSKHSRMPYYTIPDDIKQSDTALLEWAQEAITISK